MKMRQHSLKLFSLGMLLSCTVLFVHGASRTASVSGNWNNTATWGGSAVPTSSDDVTINSGITVAVNVVAACNTLSFVTAAVSNSLTISGTNSLTVTGLINMPRPNSPQTCTIAVGAGSLTAGSLTMSATTATRNDIVTISTGTLTISGAITTGTTGCQFTFTDAGTMNIGGSFTNTPTLTTFAGSTVNYTASGAQTSLPSTYSNLTLSGSGVKTFATTPTVNGTLSLEGTASITVTTGVVTYGANATLQYNKPGAYTATTEEWKSPFVATGGIIIKNTGAITTPGAVQIGNNTNVPLNIDNGATLTPGANLITLHGDFINGGTLTSGSGGITIAGTRATQSIAGFATTGTLTMSKTAGTATITGAVSGNILSVNGSGGTLVLQGANTFSGAKTLAAGTLTLANTAALGVAGAALSLNGGTLDLMTDATVNAYNITVGGAATISTDRATSGTGITHTLGTLSIGNFTLTISGGTNVTGGTAGITFGGVTHTGAPTYTVNDPAGGGATQLSLGAVTNSTFLTTFNGSGDVIQTGVFGNGSGGITYSGSGSLTLSQANTFTGGVTLNSGTLNINNASALGTIAGTFTIAGGTIQNTSAGPITTVNYPMAWNSDFTFSGSQSLNLGTGTITPSASRQVTVNNGITLTAGGNISAGTLNLTKAGAGNLNLGSSTVTLNGLTISAGTLTMVSGTLNLAGDFSNSGTFTPGSSNITITGTATQSIAGFTTTGTVSITKTGGIATFQGNVNGGAFTITGSGGTLNLGTGLTHTITGSLTLGGNGQPSGSWGGASSGADHINSTYFATATGFLNVATSGCSAGTWTGFTSTDWNIASNWCGGAVPTALTDVSILSGGNQPIIGSAAVCNNITINSGATLTITGSNTLTVSGNWTNSGTFTPNSSTVIFNGAAQTVGTGPFNNLTLAGSGTKTTTGVTVNGVLSMEGTATASVAPTYGAAATLQYNTTTARTAGVEWITTFTATGGIVIKGTGAITTPGAVQIGNNTSVPLNINSGATLTPGANLITLHGDFINGGTLTSGSGGIAIAGTTATQSIAGFATTGTLTMSKTAGTATITGTVTGNILTVNGSGGTLVLQGANTFSGTRTVATGTLVLANTTALGAAGTALALNGGTLDLMTDASVNAYNITVGGAATISTDRATTGAGVTHTLGTLSINASTLTISGGTNVTSGTAGLSFTGVTHTAAPTYTVNDPAGGGSTQLSLGAVTNSTFLTTFNGSGDVIQTGVFGNGSGGITYGGTGSLTLNQANSFTGALTVSNGTVIGTANAGALGAGTLTLSGGTLRLTNTAGTPLSFGRNTTVSANSQIMTDVNAAGAGNIYTLGTLSINASTLTVAGGTNVTSGTVGVTFGGVTHTAAPTYTVNDPTGGGITQLSLGAVTNSTFLTTFNGDGNVIQTGVFGAGSGGITYSGTGLLTLNQANTFTGALTVSNGTVVGTANAGALGAGTLTLSGGTLKLTNAAGAPLSFGRNTTVSANSQITTDVNATGGGNNYTLGTLSINGSTLTISGGTNVASGTAGVTFGAVTHTAAPTYTVNDPSGGGITQLSLGAVTNSTFLTTFNGDGNVIQTGVFGAGSGGITYSGTGSLTLNRANTFTGVLAVSSGTVIGTANAGALGAGSLTLSGGTLKLTNAAGTPLSFGRNTTVSANSQIMTDVNASGAGNNYTLGTLSINGFTLTVAGGANVTGGTAGVAFGAVTHTAAPTYTVNDPSGGGTTQLSLGAVTNSTFLTTFNGTGDVIQTGVFGNGSGGITYGGTGSLTLNQTNTFTGGVTLNSGTLNINNASALGTVGGTFTIAGGTIQNTTAGSITTVNYPMSWDGDFTFSGSQPLNLGTGTITPTASLQVTVNTGITLTAGGTINAGTLNLTKAGVGSLNLGSSTATLNGLTISAGTLTMVSGALSLAGDFSNSGTFTAGSSNITITGTATQSIAGFTTTGTVSITKTGGIATFQGNVNGGAFSVTGAGGTIGLGSGRTHNITGTLTLGGNGQISGSWGGSGSAATYINSTYFADGTGVLNVSTSSCTAGMWYGGTSTDWNTAANWCNSVVPTASTNVVILSGGNQPVIGAAAVCNNITINSGATLTINGSNTLTVSGNWINNGTFTANSGTVIFNNAAQTVGTGPFNNLSLAGSGIKTTTGVTVNGKLSMEGTATASVAPTYGANATLQYNTATARTAGVEWVSPFVATGGVIIAGTGAITLNSSEDINAPLTINTGSTLITANNNLTIEGNLTCNGTFTAGTGTVTLDGSVAQTISGSTAIAFYNLIVSNTSAAIIANTNFSVVSSGTLTVNDGAVISPAATAIISGAGTLTGAGTVQVTRIAATPDFNSQYTITNKTLSNLTVEYIGAGAQTVSAINYGNLTISTNGSRTVTLANSGTIGIAGLFSPTATTTTYIVTGSTVDFNGSGTQSINAFDYNNLTVSNSAIKQLGGAVTASSNITLGSGSTLDVTSSNFAISAGGNWINNGGTFNYGSGTVTFNGTATQAIQGTAVSQSFYNLIVNKPSGTITLPVGSTTALTVNDLTVNQGTLQINDATNIKRTINVNGDLTVQSAGSITTGTGNPNTVGYTLPSNLPPTGQYHSIFHELFLSGNFTNNGSVRFTNLTAPGYGAFAINGAVTVRFTGASDNTATLNGLTDFYNLVVDKGSDNTYTLTVSSSSSTNFSLFGPSLLGRVETTPFTPDNPEVRKSLWIKNGTLKLTGTIMIPTLSEGDGNNGNGDFAIGGNAQLWIAGPNVTVYTTATTSTGFPEAPVGATGVLSGTGYQAISVYGTFRISDGFFGTRNSAGFIFWDTSNSSAQVIFDGGVVNTSIFREGIANGKASYRQTGGTVIVRGDETESGELATYSVFDISNPNSSFVMSGGDLIFRDKNTGGTGGNGFYVAATPGNYSVTGGTITFETNPANTPSIDINSTANFWNLNIKRLASSSGTSTVNLLNNLVVSNNLTIEANARLSTGTGNFPVTVSGNFTINSGGTYTPGTNTTTFNGSGNYYLWNDGTITTGLYNLTANKTLGTLILAGTANDFTVLNNLTIARDTLADGGKNLYVGGNVINNGTHKGAGKISLNKTNGSQTISGDGTGKFQNLEINNTNGSTGSVQVSLTSNIVVTGNLTLTNDRIFDISTNLLTLDKLGSVVGTMSSSRFIRTSGAASDGGLKKIFNNTSAFTYPVGSGTNYTPATLQLNSTPTTYGSVTIKPVSLKHPLVTDPTCFNYYWKVEESGFTGIVPGSLSLQFNYGNLPDNTAYIPGVYNPVTWSYTNDVTLVDEAAKLIRFLNANSFVGDYTGGIPTAFGAAVTYYSRSDGDWNSPSTWSTVSFGGTAATSIPGASNPVYIGDGSSYNHTVTVTAGNAVAGSLSLKQGSVLNLGTTTGNNFGSVVSGSDGKLRISANSATAIFPAGDFGLFLGASGGTVEYYTSGSQDFILPATSAAPSSATIANYYNLQLTPQTGRQITMPNTDLVIYGDMTVQGASVTGLVNLNSAVARNLTINNNLNVTGGNLLFKNAFPQTLTIANNLNVSSGAIFNVSTLGTAVNNNLTIGGNLTNNGTIEMSPGSSRLCAVTFTGVTNTTISGAGATTDFYSIAVNKGTSATPVIDVTSSVLTFSNNTAPLTLINGTFRLTSPISLTLSNLGFSIPATACLSVNGGTFLIATSASDAADIALAGKLEVKSGNVAIGTSTNVNNNDIEYAGTGTPTIDVQGGSLFVNGQIRRSISSGSGSLIYKQAGSCTVTINGQNAQPTRAKLEVLNAGSDFEMSSTSTLTIVRGGGTSFNDLYLVPATSSVTGGTVIIGNSSTETANQNFSMNASCPINNLTIDGTTTSKTIALSSNNLVLLGNLNINATSVFNSNGLNLTIGGNLTNSNSDGNTGISTGGFRPGSLSQVTTFNSSTSNQTVSGISGNLTNFANLIIDNSNSAGTVTLATNSALRVNSDLTLTQGTLADGGNIITVLGNISNSSAHTGTGRIDLAGSGVQTLSGSGAGKFSNLKLNGSYDVQMTASQEITGVLTFNTKMLYIGSTLLKLSNTSSGATTGSSATSYIKTSGLVTDLGVQKSYPASALNYTFPIGIAGKYTPAVINVTANSAVGAITVIPVNSKHPATTDPLDKQLYYYWNVRSTGFSGLTATHAYTYIAGDVTGNEAAYVARRYTGAIWDATNATVTVAAHTANFTGINFIDGDFTAGELSEFGAINTYYSRNATSGGNWDDVNTWSTVSASGATAGTIPNGQPVVIAAGHTVSANGSFRNAYSIALSGTLNLAGYTGHNLGVVSGTGTIKLNPAISGNFTSPAGDFSSFTSSSGGTIELNNASGTATFPSFTIYNHLLLSGNGFKQMINSDITLNGNITISSGSTFIASSVNNLILSGNWINGGTFTHNNGNIEFNGNTTISGVSTTTFNNLTILSGKTLVGASSSGFNVDGNWVNNGTFTHNSGTVNFNNTSTISGSAVTTFNHININSSKTLTGKLNDNFIVQGNWINSGTYNHNGGTVTFAGTSTISGSSVTTFGNLVINGSSTLTAPSSGTMNISLNYTNGGTFNHNGGKVVFNGTTQTLGGTAPTQFNNLEISTGSATSISTSGQSLCGILLCNGTLTSNGNLTLLSTASQTALVDGTGIGNVSGSVTMQRYLASGFGWKYLSSPFSNATVGQFSGYVDLTQSNPWRFRRYDENVNYSGWIKYVDPAGQLFPMQGYAADLGPNPASTTLSFSGTVNNGTLVPITLANNGQPYTQGFSLIGNPYPSPIDWDAATGWTRTNVDNAIYFFNTSGDAGNSLANDSIQFQGTYSSYVNGVSTGNATNIIPAMQGFFVHVSTPHPTDATIIFNNGIRVNTLNPLFKSADLSARPLLRLSAGFADNGTPSDPAVIYFESSATLSFEKEFDAVKMMNLDSRVPNLYTISSDANKLSISGMPFPVDSITRIPLGLTTEMNGWITFDVSAMEQMPSGMHIYLVDAVAHINEDLKLNPQYRLYLRAGKYENRFSLVFSLSELPSPPPPIAAVSEKFTISRPGGNLSVNLNLQDNEKGILQMVNMAGQVLYRKEVFGNESIELNSRLSSGVYVICVISGNSIYSKKIIINKQ